MTEIERRFADAIPGMVCAARPDGSVDLVNRRWSEYTGLTLQDASGAGWQAAVHPEDLPALVVGFRAMLESGEAADMKARFRRHDGVYRRLLVSFTPQRDEAGQVAWWYGASSEIVGPEGSLSSEHDLRSIIDTIPMTAWSTGPDGYCDFVNRRWLDYAGLTLDQVQGWGWGAVIHPDDLDRVVAEWRASLASGVPVRFEARMRRFDGVYRWFLFLGNPLRDEAGHIVKWFGTNIEIEDRVRAEEALRASERNLIQTINTLPTTAWSTRPDGYCDFLSDRWLDYAGFTFEEAVGWNWASVIHPDDAQGLREYWTGCLTTGTPVDTEARMRRHDGVYRWFLFRANPLRDESGTIVKWYGTNVDIEDRKRADAALHASERNLVQTINTLPTTAWSTRPDGYCDFLSDRWLDYAGFTFEEAVGWSWASVIHPDDAQGLREYWTGCLTTGTPVDTEARMRRHDGVYRWFLFRANPLRDASGTIIKWYGTNVDIEDRKRADEALRASERDLSLIINTIPMFAWSTLPDGYCDFLNQRWLDYAGMTAEEARGWAWGAAIHPDDAKGLVDYWQAALANGTPVDTEARMRRHDGVYRWFIFRANPLRDEAGNIVRWYGTNVDIEDRRLSDEALAKVRSELTYMTRVASMGVLTASIAHEVNQPLAGIITNANTCMRTLAADPPNLEGARKTAERMIRDSNRAADVITRLRALFTKKDSAREPVDLNQAAREVVALHANELRRNRVMLRTELDDELPRITGDRIQLQQVILNLLSNAAAAMSSVEDRPRHLVIKTEKGAEGGVQLSVEDTGEGIGPGDPERLFKPFFTTKADGMGIGLSVSRTIVENHKGRLWASANEGPGATFSFSIPRPR